MVYGFKINIILHWGYSIDDGGGAIVVALEWAIECAWLLLCEGDCDCRISSILIIRTHMHFVFKPRRTPVHFNEYPLRLNRSLRRSVERTFYSGEDYARNWQCDIARRHGTGDDSVQETTVSTVACSESLPRGHCSLILAVAVRRQKGKVRRKGRMRLPSAWLPSQTYFKCVRSARDSEAWRTQRRSRQAI